MIFLRYVIYARVSTALEEQKSSFDSQTQDLKKRIKSLYPDLTFTGVYGDRGISGTTADRPDFQQMISDAHEGKFDLIITKSISRFARNTRILLNTIKDLEEVGVGIIFLEENIDTRQTTQKFLMTVLGALAEMESTNLKTHIKEGFASRRAAGKMARPSAVAFGYKLDNGSILVDPETGPIVKNIFRWFVEEGLPASAISTRLMQRGVRTRRGLAKWNRHTVLYILANPKYVGKAKETDPETGEEFFFDNYPAIVSEQVFESAQQLLSARKEKWKNHKTDIRNLKKGLYPLSQITKCVCCGTDCTRFTSHSEAPRHTCELEDDCNGHPIWGCKNFSGSSKSPFYCRTYTISEQYMYEAIIKVIAGGIVYNGLGRGFLERVREESDTDREFEKAMEVYNARLTELQNSRKSELILFRKALISESEVESNVKKIDREIAKLKRPEPRVVSGASDELIKIIESFDVKPRAIPDYDYQVIEVQEKLHTLCTDPEMKRKIVRGLVEEVQIGGEPKYLVKVKLFDLKGFVGVRISRRSPTKRHNHLLETEMDFVFDF